MHAFVMSDIGIGRRERVTDPTPSATDIVVTPGYSGLCGTDVHMFNEGSLVRHENLPLVMGHEFVGTVVEIGGDTSRRPYGETDRLRIGDEVAVEPMLPCGQCTQCLRGKSNLCTNWSHLGILEDGCWADFVRVPTARATKLPEGVSLYDAALAEPLSCAVNFVVHRGKLAVGESVLIMGAGPVGLLSIAVARAAGAGTIIVSEPQSHRRLTAELMGADLVIDPLTQDLPGVVRSNAAHGVDLIVEASGSKAAVSQSVSIASSGTRIVLSGLGGIGPTPIDTSAIVTKELTILGGFASRWAMQAGLSAIAAGRISTDHLVTSVRDWSNAEQAMQDMLSDPMTCKILFRHGN